MVTTWGATLVWSATTVTVAGGVAARLGGRRIFSAGGGTLGWAVAGACTVAGVCATVQAVEAAGATCANDVIARHIIADPVIRNASTRIKIVFMILPDTTTTSFGCSSKSQELGYRPAAARRS
jgi:hypothetical protein